ncbi:hypothetical protein NC652_036675 [Populus alba x Populus x berolinensis]|nr:hypothetical protein NC652_036675 [Populus alba x Populus x berolinensis]
MLSLREREREQQEFCSRKESKKSKSSSPRGSNALVISCRFELLFGTDSKLVFGDVIISTSKHKKQGLQAMSMISIEVKPVEDNISLLITLTTEEAIQLYYGSRQKGKKRMAFLHLPSSLALKTTCRSALTPVPITVSSRPIQNPAKFTNWVLDFRSKSLNFAFCGALALGVGVADAKVGVNKPELLPKEFTTVIDVAGFLSDGQEKRLAEEISDIEKDTGFKLRVLAQNYPDTPGLAIRDFWQVDDRTVVFVADPNFGNILNFNVGASVDLDIPRSFWSRLAGKYGNMFYWKEKVNREARLARERTSFEQVVPPSVTGLRGHLVSVSQAPRCANQIYRVLVPDCVCKL